MTRSSWAAKLATIVRSRGHVVLAPPLLLFALVTGCGAAAPPRPFAETLAPPHDGARLVVVGDFQRTAPLLEFWREQNDPERERVVRAIADAHPDLLAITGDCVFNGGSDGQWEAFDALVAPLYAERVPAIAAFGNHEYWSGRADAEAHLFARFPLDGHRHWFAFAFGPLRIVVLDANQGHLTDAEWRAQVAWYAGALGDFDRDPAVRGVVVMLHQPPYTNSTVTGDEAYVQADLVPPFARAKKTLAMLSAHVHSYERFARGGKVFVVSGGEGARVRRSRRVRTAGTPTISSRGRRSATSTSPCTRSPRRGWTPRCAGSPRAEVTSA